MAQGHGVLPARAGPLSMSCRPGARPVSEGTTGLPAIGPANQPTATWLPGGGTIDRGIRPTRSVFSGGRDLPGQVAGVRPARADGPDRAPEPPLRTPRPSFRRRSLPRAVAGSIAPGLSPEQATAQASHWVEGSDPPRNSRLG